MADKADKGNRGFASMDEQKQREIASQGGRAAHEKGTAHEFDSKEAEQAGRKGGKAVSKDREHMSQIGRKGGEARAQERGRGGSGGGGSYGGGSTRGGTTEQHREAGRQRHNHNR